MNKLEKAAAFLFDNRTSQRIVDNIPEELQPSDSATAHRIQDRLVEMLASKFDSAVCGYKLACTNEPVMELLGTDGPLSGQLMTHSMHQDGDTLQSSQFNHRIAELEFILTIGEDVPHQDQPHTPTTILPYIDKLAPGLEIVDHRFTDFTKVGANSLIADNAIHGACIMGEPNELWRDVDLSTYNVSMDVNDKTFSSGNGGNVLGSPIVVMAWLATDLNSRGKILKAGDIVTTGTVCDVYNAQSGDKIHADFGKLGSVSISFD